MNNFSELPVNNTPERYALMKVKEQTKLCCFVKGEWIVDATCRTINEMLEAGLVEEDSVTGWISHQVYISH